MKLSFTINSNGNLLIKAGQKIGFKDPIAQNKTVEEVKIPLASILGIAPQKIFNTLKKFVGDQIKKGELLAEYTGLLSAKKYTSTLDGIIKEIDHEQGFLIIETSKDENDIVLSFFTGEVAKIEDNLITLEIKNYKDFELIEVTDDFGGEVIFLTAEKLKNITEDVVKDKVIFSENIQPYEQIKLETLGAKGFVTTSSLLEETELGKAVFKNIRDLESVKKLELPYCIVCKKNNKIYTYV